MTWDCDTARCSKTQDLYSLYLWGSHVRWLFITNKPSHFNELGSHIPSDVFIISTFLFFRRSLLLAKYNFCVSSKFLPDLLPFLQFLAPSSNFWCPSPIFWCPAPNDSFHVHFARCKRELGAPVSHT